MPTVTQSSTVTRLSDRPDCPKCGVVMMLARIVPAAPGEDRRTFECPKCNYEEDVLVKYE